MAASRGRVTRLPPRPRSGRDDGFHDGDAARDVADVELLAWLLDNSIPIPLTGRRVGLDAIVGLIPGLGDVISGGLGLLVVIKAAHLRMPRIVLARMLANVALDLSVGAIPVLGDAFDLWYKSNSRNLALLRRHADDPAASTRGDWLFFAVLVGIALLVVVGVLWLIGSLVELLIGPLI